MKASKNAINLIKRFEGCRLEAYKCPAGVWTIGYGHTSNVFPGDKINEMQADTFLFIDLQRFEYCLNVHVLPKCELRQNEFDALLSFIFNIGTSNFLSSTMFRLLLQGKKDYAAQQFDKWIYAGKKILPGLITRRKYEKELFLRKTQWQQMLEYLD